MMKVSYLKKYLEEIFDKNDATFSKYSIIESETDEKERFFNFDVVTDSHITLNFQLVIGKVTKNKVEENKGKIFVRFADNINEIEEYNYEGSVEFAQKIEQAIISHKVKAVFKKKGRCYIPILLEDIKEKIVEGYFYEDLIVAEMRRVFKVKSDDELELMVRDWVTMYSLGTTTSIPIQNRYTKKKKDLKHKNLFPVEDNDASFQAYEFR